MIEPRIELVKTRAKKLYTPGATNYKSLWHIRIKAANGEVILSSETYSSVTAALKAVYWILDRGLRVGFKRIDETKEKKVGGKK